MIVIELNTDGTTNVYASGTEEIVVVDHIDDEAISVSCPNVYDPKLMDQLIAVAAANLFCDSVCKVGIDRKRIRESQQLKALKEDRCPYCTSKNIGGDGGLNFHSLQNITLSMRCEACEEKWENVYGLRGMETEE